MISKYCLNCNTSLTDKFCSHCGQKADTHRITPKHFIEHDLLHGVFHLEKGILFTIKETFVRPGSAALDYIKGKRISYYNVFYLILLILGLNVLLIHLAQSISSPNEQLGLEGDGVKLWHFLESNVKYLILSFIPLFAFNAYLIFKRWGLNYAEHHIISGFALLGCTLLAVFINLLGLLENIKGLEALINMLSLIPLFLVLLFPVYVYFIAFKEKYSRWGFWGRMILMYLLFSLEGFIIIMAIVFFVSGGHFEGTIEF